MSEVRWMEEENKFMVSIFLLPLPHTKKKNKKEGPFFGMEEGWSGGEKNLDNSLGPSSLRNGLTTYEQLSLELTNLN